MVYFSRELVDHICGRWMKIMDENWFYPSEWQQEKLESADNFYYVYFSILEYEYEYE
jgi:hypothetical protein